MNEQHLAHHPKDSQSYKCIAKCYQKLKNFKKAIESYEKLLVLDPKNKDAHLEIADYLIMDKNFSKALEKLNECLKLDLDHETKSKIYGKIVQIY